jgi:hypothetical protein
MSTSESEVRQSRKFAWGAFSVVERSEGQDSRATPCVTPERVQIANAGILYLSPIMQQLIELRLGPKNDDFGRLRPTRCAFEQTIELLLDAAIFSSFDRRKIPLGSTSTDCDGGVRIEWRHTTISVHLTVPASGSAYIYHKIGRQYATETATPQRLSFWLGQISQERELHPA